MVHCGIILLPITASRVMLSPLIIVNCGMLKNRINAHRPDVETRVQEELVNAVLSNMCEKGRC